MIDAHNLQKRYKLSGGKMIDAVNGINLAVKRGEIFSLLGPNGAGKSTTINMISGLISPNAGDARIGGFSVTTQPHQAKMLIGVVPQEIALYPMLSPRQNLAFFGQLNNLRGPALQKRIDETLAFVELTDRADDKIETFSGGMKRRINLAVGLLHRPQVVFLDEPTAGADPQSRRRILDTVLRLRDEFNMTVLYTTHLMKEAEELSDRIGIIDRGEIIGLGTLGELTQQVNGEDRLRFMVGAIQLEDTVMGQIEAEVAGVTGASYREGVLTVTAKRGRQALPQLIILLNNHEIPTMSVEVREPDLEAVFLRLTGRALRD